VIVNSFQRQQKNLEEKQITFRRERRITMPMKKHLFKGLIPATGTHCLDGLKRKTERKAVKEVTWKNKGRARSASYSLD